MYSAIADKYITIYTVDVMHIEGDQLFEFDKYSPLMWKRSI